MASGIEIVGLLLAVIPLFVSAAEQYKDGIGFVKRAVKKEQFAAQYKDELTQQRALLMLYIKGVVGRTELPPVIQLTLVVDPTGDAWRRSDVTKQISAELADAYQPFVDTIARICKTLARQVKEDTGDTPNNVDIVQLLQSLCLEHSQSSGLDSKKANLFERIKFSWRSSQRAEILAELQACNKMLEKLSVAADRAKPYARKQQSQRVHVAYERREVMQRLFDVLRDACKCTRTEARQVGLQLQIHTADNEKDLESTFQMILFLSRDIICEVSASIARAATAEPPKKRVRIVTPSVLQNNLSSGTPDKSMKILEDICKEMTRAYACKSCLQLVVDKNEKVYCSASQQPSQVSTQPTAQQLLSLTDVMSKLKLYDHKRWLHREKSILAIILAYSLLQLHNSPWLQSQWNSNTLTFIDDGLTSTSQLSAGTHLQLRRPYTRSQVTAGSSSTCNAQIPSKPSRRNAHLHALGVILLELYLNRSIQDDVTTSGTNDYRSVAQDLLEDHADDMTMTPAYLKAVRFCLCPHPNPYSGSFSFEDKGFREIYYEEVISMLEENLTSRFEVSESVWLKDV